MKTFEASIASLTFAVALTVGSLPVCAQTAPSQSAPNAPNATPTVGVENPTITARAKDVLHRIQTNTLDRSQLSSEFNSSLSPDQLTKARQQLATFGEPQQLTYDSELKRGDQTAYLYHVTLQKGQLDEIIALDQSGKISALLFRNARLSGAQAQPTP